MIAAIYARKSTDQNLSDAEKSVTRQVEHATAYATRKGWAVDPSHVDTDDAVSGAEFASGDSPKTLAIRDGFPLLRDGVGAALDGMRQRRRRIEPGSEPTGRGTWS